ncbi:glycoside hydrolase family 2 TIM barrel-domain containing protein [Flammeovirga sp. EKP202]|uniref:glycoside hydrolase family 2 TIM barrel-domain containing protein n=1 Tax=Flammeovirga sp. EKP202 TaxID=2770592 RepID=UPI00165FFF96|nr:glycoside hydrolase family 2 TIM barrel-domain containing protein [Flammeovirga sp. EKP202]MBD0401971.1 glycoside hydrolase family 2 protein [Flammeovirga sp. EKP202]
MSVLKVNLLLALLLFQSVQLYAQNKINFNADWSFQLEDSVQFTLSNYSTDHWRKLNLPHDWTIEKDFSNKFEGCTAFSPGGIGWYSKTFETPIQKEQKCFVVFDGVYNNAEFWVNGMKIGAHPYGYAPIYFDMTNYLHKDGTPNRIMVRVDHSRYADSRWYTGSGIYRNVHLVVTEDVLIPVWGTFVTTPKVTNTNATVDVKVDLLNTTREGVNSKIQLSIVDQQGAEVYQKEEAIQLHADGQETYQHSFEIQNPQLWGIDQPHLYQARIKLYNNGVLAQTENVTFGIRKLFFDKDKGFFLNDEPVKIKGVCLHHDAGLVGTAVPKDVWRQKLTLLKEGGCNAIRTSHNPASDEFLDLCDELGFLVQNEFYDEWDLPKDKRYNMHDKEVDYITRGHSEHFQKWAKTDLENTMLSSRNHPSIFQWSIGNEIEWTYPGNRGATGIFKETNKDDKIDWTLWRTEIPPHTPEEVKAFWRAFPEQTYNIGATAKKLADWTRALDTTRYVTANCILPTSSFETGYTDVLDVVGFSYKPHKYDYFKETYPHKVMMGTENVPRWYEWKAAVERDYIAGIFLWTGIDYLGERRNREWPLKATPHGLLDTAGFPRASFYMFKALWREDIPVINMYTQLAQKSIYKVNEEGVVVEKKKGYWELAPREWQEVNAHWNYEKGEKTIVEVYANCDEVELFQNGKSLGVQYLKDQEDYTYKWAVDFKKGKLEAKGKRNGEKASVSLQTVDEPFAIQIIADKTDLLSNDTDVVKLVAQLVDKKGKAVKYLEEEVTFEIEGLHRFLGTDAGDTRTIINYKHHSRETVNGQCLMMLQATENPSTVKVTAYAKNKQLGSNEVIININQNSTVEQ